MEKKNRLSNFELLRIIAMGMIVLLHCNFWMIGGVGQDDIASNPAGAFWRIFAQQICIVGANVFVMISGWFGINAKVKGGANFLYQVIYHSLVVLLVGWLIGLDITKSQIIQSLSLGSWNWFVPCYLGLFILSPVLNIFMDNTTQKSQARVLIVFFVFEALYGWLLKPDYFSGGYSIISFVGLYLLARYLHTRYEDIQKHGAVLYFSGYLFLTIIPAIISFVGLKYTGHGFSSIAYSSPIVIAASAFLFLGFSRLKVTRFESIINWGASSMFAVIMIHVHPVIAPYFKAFMRNIYAEYGDFKYTLVAIAFTILVLLICIIADQPRKYTWNKLWEGCLNPLMNKLKKE